MTDCYRFKGMPAFFEAAGVPPAALGKVASVFYVGRIVDSLSQTPEARPEARAAIFAEAIRNREIMVATLRAVDLAIAEVKDNCFPPEPKPEPRRRAPKPELLPDPEPKVSPEQP